MITREQADRMMLAGAELTDREFASLQKVASYRALVGKQAAEIRRLKAGIRDALDNTVPRTAAFMALTRALAEPSQEDAT